MDTLCSKCLLEVPHDKDHHCELFAQFKDAFNDALQQIQDDYHRLIDFLEDKVDDLRDRIFDLELKGK